MTKVVIGALIFKKDRILIAQRIKGSHLEYKWEFPGGKLLAGEREDDCLKREIKEEMGVESDVLDFFCENYYEYENNNKILLKIYITKLKSEKFTLNSHEKIKWISLGEIEDYDFAPADVPILKKIKEKYLYGKN